MASETTLQRITIGFQGTGLPLRVEPDDLAGLRRALGDAQSGWYDLRTEDGSVFLDLAKVEYVRIDAHETRVGFGL